MFIDNEIFLDTSLVIKYLGIKQHPTPQKNQKQIFPN